MSNDNGEAPIRETRSKTKSKKTHRVVDGSVESSDGGIKVEQFRLENVNKHPLEPPRLCAFENAPNSNRAYSAPQLLRPTPFFERVAHEAAGDGRVTQERDVQACSNHMQGIEIPFNTYTDASTQNKRSISDAIRRQGLDSPSAFNLRSNSGVTAFAGLDEFVCGASKSTQQITQAEQQETYGRDHSEGGAWSNSHPRYRAHSEPPRRRTLQPPSDDDLAWMETGKDNKYIDLQSPELASVLVLEEGKPPHKVPSREYLAEPTPARSPRQSNINEESFTQQADAQYDLFEKSSMPCNRSDNKTKLTPSNTAVKQCPGEAATCVASKLTSPKRRKDPSRSKHKNRVRSPRLGKSETARITSHSEATYGTGAAAETQRTWSQYDTTPRGTKGSLTPSPRGEGLGGPCRTGGVETRKEFPGRAASSSRQVSPPRRDQSKSPPPNRPHPKSIRVKGMVNKQPRDIFQETSRERLELCLPPSRSPCTESHKETSPPKDLPPNGDSPKSKPPKDDSQKREPPSGGLPKGAWPNCGSSKGDQSKAEQPKSRSKSQTDISQPKSDHKSPKRRDKSCENIKYPSICPPCGKRKMKQNPYGRCWAGRTEPCRGDFFGCLAQAFGDQLSCIAWMNRQLNPFPGMHGLYVPDIGFGMGGSFLQQGVTEDMATQVMSDEEWISPSTPKNSRATTAGIEDEDLATLRTTTTVTTDREAQRSGITPYAKQRSSEASTKRSSGTPHSGDERGLSGESTPGIMTPTGDMAKEARESVVELAKSQDTTISEKKSSLPSYLSSKSATSKKSSSAEKSLSQRASAAESRRESTLSTRSQESSVSEKRASQSSTTKQTEQDSLSEVVASRRSSAVLPPESMQSSISERKPSQRSSATKSLESRHSSVQGTDYTRRSSKVESRHSSVSEKRSSQGSYKPSESKRSSVQDTEYTKRGSTESGKSHATEKEICRRSSVGKESSKTASTRGSKETRTSDFSDRRSSYAVPAEAESRRSSDRDDSRKDSMAEFGHIECFNSVEEDSGQSSPRHKIERESIISARHSEEGPIDVNESLEETVCSPESETEMIGESSHRPTMDRDESEESVCMFDSRRSSARKSRRSTIQSIGESEMGQGSWRGTMYVDEPEELIEEYDQRRSSAGRSRKSTLRSEEEAEMSQASRWVSMDMEEPEKLLDEYDQRRSSAGRSRKSTLRSEEDAEISQISQKGTMDIDESEEMFDEYDPRRSSTRSRKSTLRSEADADMGQDLRRSTMDKGELEDLMDDYEYRRSSARSRKSIRSEADTEMGGVSRRSTMDIGELEDSMGDYDQRRRSSGRSRRSTFKPETDIEMGEASRRRTMDMGEPEDSMGEYDYRQSKKSSFRSEAENEMTSDALGEESDEPGGSTEIREYRKRSSVGREKLRRSLSKPESKTEMMARHMRESQELEASMSRIDRRRSVGMRSHESQRSIGRPESEAEMVARHLREVSEFEKSVEAVEYRQSSAKGREGFKYDEETRCTDSDEYRRSAITRRDDFQRSRTEGEPKVVDKDICERVCDKVGTADYEEENMQEVAITMQCEQVPCAVCSSECFFKVCATVRSPGNVVMLNMHEVEQMESQGEAICAEYPEQKAIEACQNQCLKAPPNKFCNQRRIRSYSMREHYTEFNQSSASEPDPDGPPVLGQSPRFSHTPSQAIGFGGSHQAQGMEQSLMSHSSHFERRTSRERTYQTCGNIAAVNCQAWKTQHIGPPQLLPRQEGFSGHKSYHETESELMEQQPSALSRRSSPTKTTPTCGNLAHVDCAKWKAQHIGRPLHSNDEYNSMRDQQYLEIPADDRGFPMETQMMDLQPTDQASVLSRHSSQGKMSQKNSRTNRIERDFSGQEVIEQETASQISCVQRRLSGGKPSQTSEMLREDEVHERRSQTIDQRVPGQTSHSERWSSGSETPRTGDGVPYEAKALNVDQRQSTHSPLVERRSSRGYSRDSTEDVCHAGGCFIPEPRSSLENDERGSETALHLSRVASGREMQNDNLIEEKQMESYDNRSHILAGDEVTPLSSNPMLEHSRAGSATRYNDAYYHQTSSKATIGDTSPLLQQSENESKSVVSHARATEESDDCNREFIIISPKVATSSEGSRIKVLVESCPAECNGDNSDKRRGGTRGKVSGGAEIPRVSSDRSSQTSSGRVTPKQHSQYDEESRVSNRSQRNRTPGQTPHQSTARSTSREMKASQPVQSSVGDSRNRSYIRTTRVDDSDGYSEEEYHDNKRNYEQRDISSDPYRRKATTYSPRVDHTSDDSSFEERKKDGADESSFRAPAEISDKEQRFSHLGGQAAKEMHNSRQRTPKLGTCQPAVCVTVHHSSTTECESEHSNISLQYCGPVICCPRVIKCETSPSRKNRESHRVGGNESQSSNSSASIERRDQSWRSARQVYDPHPDSTLDTLPSDSGAQYGHPSQSSKSKKKSTVDISQGKKIHEELLSSPLPSHVGHKDDAEFETPATDSADNSETEDRVYNVAGAKRSGKKYKEVDPNDVNSFDSCTDSQIRKIKGRITFRRSNCPDAGQCPNSKSTTVAIQNGTVRMIASPEGVKLVSCDEDDGSSSEDSSTVTMTQNTASQRHTDGHKTRLETFLSDSCMERYECLKDTQRHLSELCRALSVQNNKCYIDKTGHGSARERRKHDEEPAPAPRMRTSTKPGGSRVPYHRHNRRIHGDVDDQLARTICRTDYRSRSNSAKRRYKAEDYEQGAIDLFGQVITPEQPLHVREKRKIPSLVNDAPPWSHDMTETRSQQIIPYVSPPYRQSSLRPGSDSLNLSHQVCYFEEEQIVETRRVAQLRHRVSESQATFISTKESPTRSTMTFPSEIKPCSSLREFSSANGERNTNNDNSFCTARSRSAIGMIHPHETDRPIKCEVVLQDPGSSLSTDANEPENCASPMTWPVNKNSSSSAERDRNSSSGGAECMYSEYAYRCGVVDTLRLLDTDDMSLASSTEPVIPATVCDEETRSPRCSSSTEDYLGQFVKNLPSLAVGNHTDEAFERIRQNSLRALVLASKMSNAELSQVQLSQQELQELETWESEIKLHARTPLTLDSPLQIWESLLAQDVTKETREVPKKEQGKISPCTRKNSPRVFTLSALTADNASTSWTDKSSDEQPDRMSETLRDAFDNGLIDSEDVNKYLTSSIDKVITKVCEEKIHSPAYSQADLRNSEQVDRNKATRKCNGTEDAEKSSVPYTEGKYVLREDKPGSLQEEESVLRRLEIRNIHASVPLGLVDSEHLLEQYNCSRVPNISKSKDMNPLMDSFKVNSSFSEYMKGEGSSQKPSLSNTVCSFSRNDNRREVSPKDFHSPENVENGLDFQIKKCGSSEHGISCCELDDRMKQDIRNNKGIRNDITGCGVKSRGCETGKSCMSTSSNTEPRQQLKMKLKGKVETIKSSPFMKCEQRQCIMCKKEEAVRSVREKIDPDINLESDKPLGLNRTPTPAAKNLHNYGQSKGEYDSNEDTGASSYDQHHIVLCPHASEGQWACVAKEAVISAAINLGLLEGSPSTKKQKLSELLAETLNQSAEQHGIRTSSMALRNNTGAGEDIHCIVALKSAPREKSHKENKNDMTDDQATNKGNRAKVQRSSVESKSRSTSGNRSTAYHRPGSRNGENNARRSLSKTAASDNPNTSPEDQHCDSDSEEMWSPQSSLRASKRACRSCQNLHSTHAVDEVKNKYPLVSKSCPERISNVSECGSKSSNTEIDSGQDEDYNQNLGGQKPLYEEYSPLRLFQALVDRNVKVYFDRALKSWTSPDRKRCCLMTKNRRDRGNEKQRAAHSSLSHHRRRAKSQNPISRPSSKGHRASAKQSCISVCEKSTDKSNEDESIVILSIPGHASDENDDKTPVEGAKSYKEKLIEWVKSAINFRSHRNHIKENSVKSPRSDSEPVSSRKKKCKLTKRRSSSSTHISKPEVSIRHFYMPHSSGDTDNSVEYLNVNTSRSEDDGGRLPGRIKRHARKTIKKHHSPLTSGTSTSNNTYRQGSRSPTKTRLRQRSVTKSPQSSQTRQKKRSQSFPAKTSRKKQAVKKSSITPKAQPTSARDHDRQGPTYEDASRDTCHAQKERHRKLDTLNTFNVSGISRVAQNLCKPDRNHAYLYQAERDHAYYCKPQCDHAYVCTNKVTEDNTKKSSAKENVVEIFDEDESDSLAECEALESCLLTPIIEASHTREYTSSDKSKSKSDFESFVNQCKSKMQEIVANQDEPHNFVTKSRLSPENTLSSLSAKLSSHSASLRRSSSRCHSTSHKAFTVEPDAAFCRSLVSNITPANNSHSAKCHHEVNLADFMIDDDRVERCPHSSIVSSLFNRVSFKSAFLRNEMTDAPIRARPASANSNRHNKYEEELLRYYSKPRSIVPRPSRHDWPTPWQLKERDVNMSRKNSELNNSVLNITERTYRSTPTFDSYGSDPSSGSFLKRNLFSPTLNHRYKSEDYKSRYMKDRAVYFDIYDESFRRNTPRVNIDERERRPRFNRWNSVDSLHFNAFERDIIGRNWNESANNGSDSSSSGDMSEPDDLDMGENEHKGELPGTALSSAKGHYSGGLAASAEDRSGSVKHLKDVRVCQKPDKMFLPQMHHPALVEPYCLCCDHGCASYEFCNPSYQVQRVPNFAARNINGSGNMFGRLTHANEEQYRPHSSRLEHPADSDDDFTSATEELSHSSSGCKTRGKLLRKSGQEIDDTCNHPDSLAYYIGDGPVGQLDSFKEVPKEDFLMSISPMQDDGTVRFCSCQQRMRKCERPVGRATGQASTSGTKSGRSFCDFHAAPKNTQQHIDRSQMFTTRSCFGQGDISNRRTFTQWYVDDDEKGHNSRRRAPVESSTAEKLTGRGPLSLPSQTQHILADDGEEEEEEEGDEVIEGDDEGEDDDVEDGEDDEEDDEEDDVEDDEDEEEEEEEEDDEDSEGEQNVDFANGKMRGDSRALDFQPGGPEALKEEATPSADKSDRNAVETSEQKLLKDRKCMLDASNEKTARGRDFTQNKRITVGAKASTTIAGIQQSTTDHPPVQKYPGTHDKYAHVKPGPSHQSKFSLEQIKVPAIEKERVRFACDENGDWAEIGRGSYGCVYLGLLDGIIEVAIKDFYESSSWDLVIHEARMLMFLQDTGITPKFYGLRRRFDITKQPSEYCIIMEYFGDGRTLFNVMSDKVTLTGEEWMDIVGQLVAGLRLIHRKSVLINDLKADNILIDLTGGRKLIRYIDVGMATYKQGLTFQLPQDQMSKYNFLAPEVREGARTTTRSDIYSLGYMLEQMCRLADTTLGGLKKLVNKCMEKNPARRPDIDDIVSQVHRFIAAKASLNISSSSSTHEQFLLTNSV